jgi:hypothetical protein
MLALGWRGKSWGDGQQRILEVQQEIAASFNVVVVMKPLTLQQSANACGPCTSPALERDTLPLPLDEPPLATLCAAT